MIEFNTAKHEHRNAYNSAPGALYFRAGREGLLGVLGGVVSGCGWALLEADKVNE